MDEREIDDPFLVAAARERGVKPDWERVGRYASRRREELVEKSLADLIRESGVSDKTWRRLTAGEPVVQSAKLAAMSRALGWTADSLQAILYGGPPTVETGDAISTAVFSQLDMIRSDLDALQAEILRLGGRQVLEDPTAEPE